MFSVKLSINFLKRNIPKSIGILKVKYCIYYIYCVRPSNPLCISLMLSYFCQNSSAGKRPSVQIFTNISLTPPCLNHSRSPGLLINITNKTNKVILLVRPFTDFILLLLETNLFSTVIWGTKNERSFSGNSESHSPDLRNKRGRQKRILLFPQEIWKKAY